MCDTSCHHHRLPGCRRRRFLSANVAAYMSGDGTADGGGSDIAVVVKGVVAIRMVMGGGHSGDDNDKLNLVMKLFTVECIIMME